MIQLTEIQIDDSGISINKGSPVMISNPIEQGRGRPPEMKNRLMNKIGTVNYFYLSTNNNIMVSVSLDDPVPWPRHTILIRNLHCGLSELTEI